MLKEANDHIIEKKNIKKNKSESYMLWPENKIYLSDTARRMCEMIEKTEFEKYLKHNNIDCEKCDLENIKKKIA